MLRPPTTDGRGESDVHDYDDNELPVKRGQVDDLDSHPDSRPADDQGGVGSGQGDDLPERLGERIENGSSSTIATGGPDVLPDVEPPETTM
jgi:hypothetical protein